MYHNLTLLLISTCYGSINASLSEYTVIKLAGNIISGIVFTLFSYSVLYRTISGTGENITEETLLMEMTMYTSIDQK